jgi:hypothetical protein
MAEKNVPGGFLGAGGLQIPPVIPGTESLAATYAIGTAPADQTLILTNARGGAFILNGTTPGPTFTGVTVFEVNVVGGSMNFYTKGGFDVSSIISVAAAVGANWDSVHFLASTLTLTGGPTTVTQIAMVHVGAAVVNGAGNTVADAYNLLIDAAPAGTATLTRAWSLGVVGATQFGGNIFLPNGAVATPAIAFNTDPTCGLYHTGTSTTGSILAAINGVATLALTSQILAINPGTLVVTSPGQSYIQLGYNQNIIGETGATATGSLGLSQNARYSATVWTYISSSQASNYYQNAGTHVWRVAATGVAAAAITWVTAMTIANTARVGIGITNPSEQLTVNGAVSVTGTSIAADANTAFLGFQTTSGGLTGATFGCRGPDASTRGALNFFISRAGGGASLTPMVINNVGNIGIGTNAPGANTQLQIVATSSLTSAAGAVWNGVNFAASTLTLTGATTPVTALSFVTFAIPTISAASAITVASAATLAIEGAPVGVGAGPATITNAYALWVKAGGVRVAALAGVGTRAVVADANGVLSAP